jgi:hypothetical protein
MTCLSEDPTYLVGGFLVLTGAFVIALKITQQSKYVLSTGIPLTLALVVGLIKWIWTTDNEPIQKVVHDVRRGELNSDAEKVSTHLTCKVMYTGMALAEP